jgi:exodeoxyribonuclease V alpha subunit
MIAALKTKLFNYQLQLREIGIPSYILDNYDELQLERMLVLVKTNPWCLYNIENGFSLKLCEQLAEKFHIDDELEKGKVYLQAALDKIASQGHTYGKEWQINSFIKSCNFTDYVKQKAINSLQNEGLLFVSDKGNYFLSKYYNSERSFAELLKNLAKQNGYFTGFRKDYSFLYEELNDDQKNVVDALEYNKLVILTGLPGTGKTTTVRAIVESFGSDNVVLLAPTGKAASRMSELCGIPASTLHSFFFNPNGYVNIIENKIVIIDETSMLDAEIAGWISNGIGEGCCLLLVGDPNQLPSIGPGEVLKCVLDSRIGLSYHLDIIMRQSPGSIIKSAHNIHAGNNLVYGSDHQVLSYFPKRWDLERIASKICQHPEWRDAQYLSVLKEKGSTIINKIAQNILNPSKIDGFHTGDHVIHVKNNKDLGISNGECGVIINSNLSIIRVEYKDKIIEYPHSLLWQLELSYCITVHKSQGSEYNKVVLFVNESSILNRNLIYTAITRAKNKILIIAPSENVLQEAIQNKQKSRQTSLRWLLEK